MHKHEILVRLNNNNQTTLVVHEEHEKSADFALFNLENTCDYLAKKFAFSSNGVSVKYPHADAVIYKIDGEIVHFVSKFFYLYPNYTD